MSERFTRTTFASFRVLPWSLDGRRLSLNYAFDEAHRFTEVVTLPVELASGGPMAGLIDLLAVAAGTSYFKAAAPLRVSIETGRPLSRAGLVVAEALYDHGLREFAVTNELPVPLPTVIDSPVGDVELPAPASGARALIPCGGGRDSSLLTSVLAGDDPYLLSIKPNPYVDRIAERFGLQVFQARRSIDAGLLALNADGSAMNGHVPVTAINSLISCVVAGALGCGDVVMANERSASMPSRVLGNGAEVNHQYSKSLAFEALLQAALDGGPRWYSALRPWSELAIARAVVQAGLLGLVMSCNRAFNEYNQRSDGWCRRCDKCRFVYLTFAPFATPVELSEVFGDDLLADVSPESIEGFSALCRADRPFDCVGEEVEARGALTLLAEHPDWRDHGVVRHLAERFAPVGADEMVELFAADPRHCVPDDLLLRLEPRFVGADVVVGRDPAGEART